MKLKLILAIALTACAMAQTNVVMIPPPPQATPGDRIDVILTAVVAVVGLVAKLLHSKSRRNSTAAEVMIRAIEEANNPDVKAAIATLAEREGMTQFIHKKVKNVTKEKKDPPPPPPGLL